MHEQKFIAVTTNISEHQKCTKKNFYGFSHEMISRVLLFWPTSWTEMWSAKFSSMKYFAMTFNFISVQKKSKSWKDQQLSSSHQSLQTNQHEVLNIMRNSRFGSFRPKQQGNDDEDHDRMQGLRWCNWWRPCKDDDAHTSRQPAAEVLIQLHDVISWSGKTKVNELEAKVNKISIFPDQGRQTWKRRRRWHGH